MRVPIDRGEQRNETRGRAYLVNLVLYGKKKKKKRKKRKGEQRQMDRETHLFRQTYVYQ